MMHKCNAHTPPEVFPFLLHPDSKNGSYTSWKDCTWKKWDKEMILGEEGELKWGE